MNDINIVKYNDEEMAISNLATRLCGSRVNGFAYFIFENESLRDRRSRMESE